MSGGEAESSSGQPFVAPDTTEVSPDTTQTENLFDRLFEKPEDVENVWLVLALGHRLNESESWFAKMPPDVFNVVCHTILSNFTQYLRLRGRLTPEPTEDNRTLSSTQGPPPPLKRKTKSGRDVRENRENGGNGQAGVLPVMHL
jgi:hypothetical protein